MKTAKEIFSEMCETYTELTGITVNDGCDMAVRLYAAAAQIESIYIYNDWVKKQCFPQTATDEYLDLHAEMRGLKRNNALRAVGIIKFMTQAPAEHEVEVPIGTVCVTAAGIRYKTVVSGTIAIGETSCYCLSQADEVGSEGNVAPNTIVYMQPAPIGVYSCVNEAPFSGGTDSEDDEVLRARIISTYSQLPNGANAAFYEKLAMSIPGVAAVKVIPKNRGIGTVDIVITGHEGMPDEDLIDEVLMIMNYSREICVDIQVNAPAEIAVDISVNIEVENGYSHSDVADRVKTAIEDIFSGKLLGCDILKAKLGCIIYGVEGVHNYSIITPVDDIKVTETQLPILGTITIGELS